MAREAMDAIRAGLEDAIAYAKGRRSRGQCHRIKIADIDVRALRHRLKLTQRQFAEIFAVSLGTVRNWEQGRRRPEGPARVLLMVIQREPGAVLRALGYRAA
jgi:putative transcriptional regulator